MLQVSKYRRDGAENRLLTFRRGVNVHVSALGGEWEDLYVLLGNYIVFKAHYINNQQNQLTTGNLKHTLLLHIIDGQNEDEWIITQIKNRKKM